MNEQEEIDKLRGELHALQQDIQGQHAKLRQLQQRLDMLSGVPEESSSLTPQATKEFSFENFIGLRLIHLIGIVVLVIGLSIGVKYAIDRNFISEGLRISLAYAAGLVLYFLSVRLKKNYTGFSAILFSGAMASLYFTTYAAHVYYELVPFAVAYIIMILLTVGTVLQAIRYNREEIALLGLIGAYGIPFLISKNADRADLFFIYIGLINFGAVFLSVRKLWKNTGVIAQVATWLLFIGWTASRFTAEQTFIGVAFLLYFFFLFYAGVLSYKLFHGRKLQGGDAHQLLVNNLAFYIGVLFIGGFSQNADTNLSMLTLYTSGFVALQAFLFYKYLRDELYTIRLLSFSALTLFVLFIAFRWDGLTVTLLWLLTAVIVFSYGFFIRSVATRMAAIVLIGLTLGKLLFRDSERFSTVQKVIAYLVLGVLLLVVSFLYQKYKHKIFGEKG